MKQAEVLLVNHIARLKFAFVRNTRGCSASANNIQLPRSHRTPGAQKLRNTMARRINAFDPKKKLGFWKH